MRRVGDSCGEGRIAYFDNLKFMLIALVVIGHTVGSFSGAFPAYGRLYFFIYIFHMPMFMFVTGLFSRRVLGYGRPPGEPPEYRPGIGRAAGFLVLYLMLNFGIFAIRRFVGGVDVAFDPLYVRNASWYFLACCILTFVCALTGGAGRGLSPPRKAMVVLAAVLAAVMLGCFGGYGDLLSLSRIVCLSPFFLAGLYIGPERLARVARGPFAACAGRARGKAAIIIPAAVLVAVAVAVFAMPEPWMAVRAIILPRNPYFRLGELAAYGPLLRLAWYAVASALGLCVMALVPARATFFTRLGSNTMGVYIWHLLLLRLLYAGGFVPAVIGLAGEGARAAEAALIPLGLALGAVFLFSLRPPFGVIAGKVMNAMYALATSRTRRGFGI